jgi:formylglycine-generating enzyme required for sulfatase activity
MQSDRVANRLRLEAGLVLGRLGWQPEGLDTFLEVSPGKFLYGENKDPLEIPYRYWIARYPVTNGQFAGFLAADGYMTRAYWSEQGWSWKENIKRTQPRYWDDGKYNNPIFPVVGVSRYEAEAYTAWLTQKLRAGGRLPEDYSACLPSEEEWERGARGTDGRVYPWGKVFQKQFANTREANAGGTTCVGTFPQGISPVGAWDMSGNVWEWTRASQGQAITGRGGSWAYFSWDARCAYRDRDDPDLFANSLGFRPVLSLADSGF